MIRKLLRFVTRQAKYERGYVEGFDAAERTMVPRAFEDGRIAERRDQTTYRIMLSRWFSLD